MQLRNKDLAVFLNVNYLFPALRANGRFIAERFNLWLLSLHPGTAFKEEYFGLGNSMVNVYA